MNAVTSLFAKGLVMLKVSIQFFESLPHQKQKTGYPNGYPVFGTAKGTRTPDLLIRSQSLYPTELSPHVPIP